VQVALLGLMGGIAVLQALRLTGEDEGEILEAKPERVVALVVEVVTLLAWVVLVSPGRVIMVVMVSVTPAVVVVEQGVPEVESTQVQV
jgi:hypothetical protein